VIDGRLAGNLGAQIKAYGAQKSGPQKNPPKPKMRLNAQVVSIVAIDPV
jgi:hypothetical protein